MRGILPALLCLGCMGLCASGCRAFDETLLEKAVDAGTVDAAMDGGMDAATPGCTLRRPPPRPDVPNGPGTGEVVFALRDIVLDQDGDRWRTIGYDLDGLCSEAPDPEVECLPPSPSAAPETDGEGGTDNVLGHQVLPVLLVVQPDLEEESREEENHGTGVIVIQVRGWNGEDDDPRVDAIMSQTVFGTRPLPDGGAPDAQVPDGGIRHGEDGNAPPLPEWDGKDWWWSRDDGFLAGNPERPRVQDDNAYVSGGMLVMRIPDNFPIIFGGTRRGIVFVLTDAILTLRISEDRQRVEEAILAGRWPVHAILEEIEHGGICRGSDDYRRLERIGDLAADVRVVRGSGGPGAICDALSIGIAYSGVRARWAGVAPAGGIPNPCADAGTGGGT